MRKLVVAALTAALCAAAVPAYAHPTYHYQGGCVSDAVSDGTDSPQTTWTGTARVEVVATTSSDPPVPVLVPISVECHLYFDGIFHSVVLSASGLGAASNVSLGFTYQADPDAVMTWCVIVEVGGDSHADCYNGDTPPSPPVPMPAYGWILVKDEGLGLGATMTTSYDAATWDCSLAASVTTAVATCTPRFSLVTFDCPLMILTTSTELTGKAGGNVQCNAGGQSLDTGVVAGTNSETRSGDIGTVTSIVCKAYGGFPGALVPPYEVFCNEPGAPEVVG